MTSKQFLLRLLTIVFVLTGAVVVANANLDLYGLFRRDHSAGLKVFGEERICKYLFSYRYIPQNFDALLLGSSASENIPLKTVAGLNVYNASLNGGNMTEAKDLGLNALGRGHFKLVILAVNRYLMQNAGHKTNFMVPERYWGALGSIQLFTATLGRQLDQARIRRTPYDIYGAQSYGETSASARDEIQHFASRLERGERTNWIFEVDPRAYRDLQELVRTVHGRGAMFVAFYPPMPTTVQEAVSSPLSKFQSVIRSAFGPEDTFIDFNRPEYRFFSDDYTNYREASHLSDTGGKRLAVELNRAVAAVVRERGGVVATHATAGGR